MDDTYLLNSRFVIKADLHGLLWGTLERWCRDRHNSISPRLVFHFLGGGNLQSIFDDFGWAITIDAPGSDITGIDCKEDCIEPTKNDEFFHVIAPFVDEGSFIETQEGGHNRACTWRWYFDGKTVERQFGTVVYNVKKCPLEFQGCSRCVFSLLCLSGQEPPISVGECCECGKRVYFHKKKKEIINVRTRIR